MRRFLLLAPLIYVLSSCGYGSLYEAKEACEKWKNAGGAYQIPNLFFPENDAVKVPLRSCLVEEKIKKVIGRRDISKRKGAFYKTGGTRDTQYKVIKRFEY
tara:strand:- start:404 stop:706 length:303 start_codon:yes stop_codon:yes gene_type:complete